MIKHAVTFEDPNSGDELELSYDADQSGPLLVDVAIRPTGTKVPRSTTLTLEELDVVVAFANRAKHSRRQPDDD